MYSFPLCLIKSNQSYLARKFDFSHMFTIRPLFQCLNQHIIHSKFSVNIYWFICVYILVILNTEIQWLKNIIHFSYVEIAQRFVNLVNTDKNGEHYLENLFPNLTLHQIYLNG